MFSLNLPGMIPETPLQAIEYAIRFKKPAEIAAMLDVTTRTVFNWKSGVGKGYTGKRFLAPAPESDFWHRSSEAIGAPSVIRLRGFRAIH